MRSHPKKQWKIGTVENCRHHWYLLIWIAYLVLFYIAEHVVTDHYWVSYLPLDDKIPFCRYFIIPYCMWHPLLFAMTLYLMWYDVPAFKRFMVYIGLGFGGSILFCLAFPNGQDLRPETFEKKNMLFTPALSQDIRSTVVQTAYACIKALGREPIFNEGGSANSCIPISMGIPAICLGGEIANFVPGEKVESFSGEGAFKGVQSILLTVLALSGVKGVTPSLI